jgi:hypothetical protein
MGRIIYICSFLIVKPEERELFRNTHTFQDLGVVANHFTHGGNNFQSCTVAGVMNLHQEINMHLTLTLR